MIGSVLIGGTPIKTKSKWAERPRYLSLMKNVADLAQAAVQLNEKSTSINTTISQINEKLAELNLGIELWLEGAPLSSSHVLGFRSLENRWQLTIRSDFA